MDRAERFYRIEPFLQSGTRGAGTCGGCEALPVGAVNPTG